MLAALPLRALDDRGVDELLEQALAEVGLSYYPRSSREAEEAALAVMARRTVSRAVRLRDLASWAHRAFGHDRLPLAERLAELDDVYDMVEQTALTAADVDADVVAEHNGSHCPSSRLSERHRARNAADPDAVGGHAMHGPQVPLTPLKVAEENGRIVLRAVSGSG